MSEISPNLVIRLNFIAKFTDMPKIQLKSDKITAFGGLYSIFHQFDSCGLRRTIDSTLGKRSSDPKAMLKNFYLFLLEKIADKVSGHLQWFAGGGGLHL